MDLPSRHIVLGMAMGAISATALAAIGPGSVIKAFGDEISPGFDTSGLVKFEGHDYEVEHEDWVSTEPKAHSRIKKVEAGRVSFVDVVTTATGTYSSDALFSGHIQYPGIAVERQQRRPANLFSGWSQSYGWRSFTSSTAGSFHFLRTGDTAVTVARDITCIYGQTYRVC